MTRFHDRMPAKAFLLPLLATTMLCVAAHSASAQGFNFVPGDLIVSSSTYMGTASTVSVGQSIVSAPVSTGTYVNDGTYPQVFNNATVDSSFGVSSPLYLNQFSIGGTETAPTAAVAGVFNVTSTLGIATSFSSKSEGALNLSPNGQYLTFADYATPINVLDVSNANTPGITEPGNYTANPTARAVVNLDSSGNGTVFNTNAYPGNNPRAAINTGSGYILVGNAGNGNGSAQVTAANGVQVLNPATDTQTAGAYNTTKAGSFSITQINPATGNPYAPAADKTAKDDNYRGETIFNNTLYTSKGSGSNGINSVYQVGNTGVLPTGDGTAAINVLNGFPTTLAKNIAVTAAGHVGELGVTVPTGKVDAGFYPFGLFMANSTTMYVADEGNGKAGQAGTDIEAGLQKWSLVSGKWTYDYTLQSGLNLGQVYDVCPPASATCSMTALSAPTGTDYTTETDGLRNITGVVNPDGTVSIFAITSTVSDSGDQGADPNELVAINDSLAATTLPGSEGFVTLETAQYGQVLRGVSEAPVPEPASMAVLGVALAGLGAVRRRR